MRVRCTPSRIVKIDPYLSAMLPNVIWAGFDPRNRCRWPIKGQEPPASGGSVVLRGVIWILLNIHNRKKRNRKKARIVAMKVVADA
jgi:hypothetical protein